MRIWGTIFIVGLLAVSASSFAASSSEKFPRTASLKRTEVNVRAGPGTRYPILWIFQRKGWPVELIGRYDNWYKLRDLEGEEGWAYLGMISSRQTAVVSQGDAVAMYQKPEQKQKLLRLGEGVVLGVEDCAPLMCRVTYDDYEGWVDKTRLLMLNER